MIEIYKKLREEHIVNVIYGGNDLLPLETKEELLDKRLGGGCLCVHSTKLDEDGLREGNGHVNYHERVGFLEYQVLMDGGFIKPKLH